MQDYYKFAFMFFIVTILFVSQISCKSLEEFNEYQSRDTVNGVEQELNEIIEVLDDNLRTKRQFCPIKVKPSSATCQRERQQDVNIARQWYEPTAENVERKTVFPLPMPWLNQAEKTLSFHAALDRDENHWASVATVLRKAVAAVDVRIKAEMKDSDFFKYEDYKKVYRMFNAGIKSIHAPQYFGNPAFGEDLENKIIEEDYWLSDEFFEQKRLAGPCPFQLKRVVQSRVSQGIKLIDLKKLLNPSFEWNRALIRAYGANVDLNEVVKRGELYVVYHPEFNGISTMEDKLDIDPTDTRTLMDMTSPIAVFIQHSVTRALKVVAIQIDYKPDSAVFHPESDAFDWLFAKSMVESVDSNICQAINHLSHIHCTSTIYCLLFRRHFSKQHPLYDLMKHHCEATTPQIAMLWPALTAENLAGSLLTGMGHLGFVNLSLQAYEKHHYGILDFDNVLRTRGLYNTLLPYHPFRDDGYLIWNQLRDFAKSFVNIYYSDDKSVAADNELQLFANEVSVDGDDSLSADAGKGKVTNRYRSSITIPKEGLHKFRDIVEDMISKMEGN